MDVDCLARDTSTGRPQRGEPKSSAYTVEPSSVEGASVLLLDDTWTSGASAASPLPHSRKRGRAT